jgi:hypothetical protein
VKVKQMLETPIGHFASASLANHPELGKDTPRNTHLLVEFAATNGITIEGVICALVNWMGSNCEDRTPDEPEEPEAPKYIN